MARLMKILEAIDISETERESARTFVYYVENGDAKKLADILKTIYVEKKGVAPRPAVTATPIRPLTLPGVQQLPGTTIVSGEVEGEVSITPYEDINAIIIKTTPRNFLTIAETLKKLDILPKQVLIEVMIAEVTLGNSDSMGVEWTLQRALGGHRWGTFGLRGTMPNATGSTAIAPFPVPTITTTNTQTSSTTTSTTTGTNPNLPGLVADVLDSTRLFEVLINLYGSSNRLNVLASVSPFMAILYCLIARSNSFFASYVTPRLRCSSGLSGSSSTMILGRAHDEKAMEDRSRTDRSIPEAVYLSSIPFVNLLPFWFYQKHPVVSSFPYPHEFIIWYKLICLSA